MTGLHKPCPKYKNEQRNTYIGEERHTHGHTRMYTGQSLGTKWHTDKDELFKGETDLLLCKAHS